MHKKYHKKFKILDILAVTTQAREGIETWWRIYLYWKSHRNNSSPWGHWNMILIGWSASQKHCNNSSPWGHWNMIWLSAEMKTLSNNSSPWGHWNSLPSSDRLTPSSNNSSPWGHWNCKVNRCFKCVMSNNSSPWGHWNSSSFSIYFPLRVTTQAREGIETTVSLRISPKKVPVPGKKQPTQ